MSAFEEQNEHGWTREQMATALAGGLFGAELARFEEHLKTCADCGKVWDEMLAGDRKLEAMFAHARADEGLEDRVIQRLRSVPVRRRWIHPSVSFAATGIAATIILGGFGFMVNQAIEQGSMPGILARRGAVYSDARQDGVSGTTNWFEAHATSQPASGNPTTYGWPDAAASPNKLAEQSVDRVRALYDSTDAASMPVDEDADKSKLNYSGGFGNAGSLTVSGGSANRAPKSATIVPAQATAPAPQIEVVGGTVTRYSVATDAEKVGKAAESGVNRGGEDNSRFYFSTADTSGRSTPGVQKQMADTAYKPMGDASQLRKEVALGLEQQKDAPGAPMLRETVTQSFAKAKADVPGDNMKPAPAAPLSPQPSSGAPGEGANALTTPLPDQARPATTRKIIRNGQMEFEVDRFDSAFAIVSKVTTEAGGYVGSTNSEKLPNGKVKGSVVVRIPPERLDTVVLQFRSLGELKSQKLEAQDISKHYQDLDSELTADRAMEARLLEIIKTSKGQIKDLLAAEKELATWREKIEKIVGEMKYYDNLVSLSTLSLTLFEKDIKTAAAAVETETIDTGVETSDVEKARTDALKAIEEAKGRVVQSDLKRFDAGQFAATIVAEVAADRAGPLLDRIKQLGKVARLDVQRKQTSGEPGTGAASRVERKETRFNISLYNLANVAPRVTTNLNLAAEDAEGSYRAILARVEKAGGRVITSNLDRKPNQQVSGTIGFEVPTAEADAVAAEMKLMGEVMKLAVAENPDVNNVTTAKRGFTVALFSTSGVAPRETAVVQVAASKVADARNAVALAAEAAGARVLSSSLNEQDRQNVTANVDLEVKREKLAEFEKAVAAAGDMLSRNVTRSTDTENTIDSKVRIQLALVGVDKIPPRQTTILAIEVGDVDAAVADLQSATSTAGGKVAMSNLSKDRSGRIIGRLVLEAPLSSAADLTEHAKKLGTVRVLESTRNEQAPEGKLAKARLELTLANSEAIVRPENGLWASIRNALATSAAGLLWSLQIVIVGLCFVLPWVVLLWGGWRVWKRRKSAATAA